MRTAFALTILLAASAGWLGAPPALPDEARTPAAVQAEPAALVLKPVGALGPGAKKEVSGIVRGLRTHDGQAVFWTQNDSGDEPRVYPIRADGSLITSAREPESPGTLIGGAVNRDWEDIALLRRPDGTSQIIVPDFGNNSNARADLAIYFIEEPEPTESRTTFTRKVLFRYPDQPGLPAPQNDFNYDAEGLFTVGEEVFILSKNRSDTFTKLYRLDDQAEGVVNTLTYVDRFDVGGRATGADCSPDGLRLAILTYTHVWLFERASVEQPFFAGRVRCRPYRLEGQKANVASDSEAICFEDDSHLLLADETTAMLYRVPIAEIPEVRPARTLALPDLDCDIHVASFNIRYAAAKDGDNAWPLRRDRVRDAIANWNADIIGMQEVEAEQADWLRARFPRYVFHGVGRTDGQRAGEFAPILFRRDRFEPVDSGHFWLSPTPETPGSRGWDAALERMASWARLKDRATGRTLLVLNTHLDHRGVEARVRSLELIRERVASLANGDPLIITGDFNTSADGEPARALCTRETGGLGLYDTFRHVYPILDGDENTFCDWDTPPAKPLRLLGDRIDWIVASRGVETVWSDIDRRTPGGRLISDHFPVRARLRVATP